MFLNKFKLLEKKETHFHFGLLGTGYILYAQPHDESEDRSLRGRQRKRDPKNGEGKARKTPEECSAVEGKGIEHSKEKGGLKMQRNPARLGLNMV